MGTQGRSFWFLFLLRGLFLLLLCFIRAYIFFRTRAVWDGNVFAIRVFKARSFRSRFCRESGSSEIRQKIIWPPHACKSGGLNIQPRANPCRRETDEVSNGGPPQGNHLSNSFFGTVGTSYCWLIQGCFFRFHGFGLFVLQGLQSLRSLRGFRVEEPHKEPLSARHCIRLRLFTRRLRVYGLGFRLLFMWSQNMFVDFCGRPGLTFR